MPIVFLFSSADRGTNPEKRERGGRKKMDKGKNRKFERETTVEDEK